MEAKFQRTLKAGKQYDALIPKSKGIETVLITGNAGVPDTMVELVKMVYETLGDTSRLAPVLVGKNLVETTKNIWHFIHDHIQYTPDTPGTEQLRRPSRSWKDRVTGVDCDCYSITASSILTNLGIPHLLCITKYDGRPNYQHIYVVVPKNGDTSNDNLEERNNYIVIDCVPDQYDFEVPFSEVHYFAMTRNATQQQAALCGLMGLGDVRTVKEFPLTDLKLPTEITSSSATTSNIADGPNVKVIENKFFKMNRLTDQSAEIPTATEVSSDTKDATTGKKTRGGSVILACVFGASILVLGVTATMDPTKKSL